MSGIRIVSRNIILAATVIFGLLVSQTLLKGESTIVDLSPIVSSGVIDQRDQELEKPLKALRGEDSSERHNAVIALGRSGNPAAVEPLITALNDSDTFVRSFAAIALGNLKDPKAVGPLVKKLADESPRVRRSAAEALGALGNPGALDPLINALSDDDIFVRRSAALALGALGNPGAADALIKALADSDSYIWNGASVALTDIGKACIPKLIGALPDWDLGPRVAEVLKNLNWQASSDEEKIRFNAAARNSQALLQNWETTRKILLSDANSANNRQAENAVFALIGIGREDSLEDLAKIMRSRGTPEMAKAFLDSGNARLAELAHNWASEQKKEIPSGNGYDIVKWGALKSQS